MSDIVEPLPEMLEAFWADARVRAKLNRLEVFSGPRPLDSLQPPAFAFGASAQEADDNADRIVAGEKTAVVTQLAGWEAAGEPLPAAGSMEIVVNSHGRPRALIATTAVRVVPFGQVDSAAAIVDEGAGLQADTPVVVQEFRVLVRR